MRCEKDIDIHEGGASFPFFIAALGVKSVNHQGEAYLCSGSKSCSKVRGLKSEMNGEAASVEE